MQWGYVLQNPSRAYQADCPTLIQYDALYGDGSSAYWMELQVSAIYGSSSNKEKGVVDGISLFCKSFSSLAAGFKLSELLLFFARYKAGMYDNSFSTFDTRRIGNAFFKEFIPQRNMELDRINRENTARAIEARRFIPPEGKTSRQWYLELKELAKTGDKEAIRLLTPP